MRTSSDTPRIETFLDDIAACIRRACLAAAMAVIAAILLSAQPARYDLIIRNGRIVDGSGNAWYRADVAVKGDTIAAIGHGIAAPANRTIDVRGQVVSSGFIDIHSHGRGGIFDAPAAENYIRQGVTTIVEGQDGGSPIPLRPFLEQVAATPTTLNLASFIGQGSIRRVVMGPVDRRPDAAELECMRELVRQGMRDGAFGLSSGLFYVPGIFTPTDEIIDLARVAGEMGGIYISHIRNEAGRLVDSVREAIEIGEKGGLPAQITHHKVIGVGNWGRSVDTLRLVAEARARGVDVTIDQYPYTASSTGLGALLPSWALEGGREQVLTRLADPVTRRKIHAAIVESIKVDRGGGDPRNVQIASCAWDPSLAGKNLAEITRSRGGEPTVDRAAHTAIWMIEQGGCQAIFHAIGEEDLERILRSPYTMIASDGGIPMFGQGSPHPRSYGTYARVLARYVREKKILTLEEAVRKMSSFPAQRMGLADRGLIRPGLKADIVVFDPERIQDHATFEVPHQYAEGVSVVIVNGEVVFENGQMTAARPGRVLWGPARSVEPAAIDARREAPPQTAGLSGRRTE
jgi:N-acyl-D-amino-acid deacylase